MTTATARADLSVIKARQQRTWASGDYAVVASRIVLASELLADAADLEAGWQVLDVACGNGNATLAAARCGTYALGIDYVPGLLEGGRARAVAEGLDVEFRLGDTEDLPVPDGSFDAVLSVFGAMFAPDHQRAADEIIRAARPGGTVGLASWTPDGFIGQMFGVITRHVPGPPKDGSGGHADTRSGITRRDLMRKARPLATWHRPKAGAVLTPAAARLHRRQLGKVVSWTGRERLRFVCCRLRFTVREMHTTGRSVQLCVDGRAISAIHPEGNPMPTASTGLATRRYQELAAAPRAGVITQGDPGYDQAPERCKNAAVHTFCSALDFQRRT